MHLALKTLPIHANVKDITSWTSNKLYTFLHLKQDRLIVVVVAVLLNVLRSIIAGIIIVPAAIVMVIHFVSTLSSVTVSALPVIFVHT